MKNLIGTKVYIQTPGERDFLMFNEVLVAQVYPEHSLILGTLLNRFCCHPSYRENGAFVPFSVQQAKDFGVVLDDQTKLINKPAEFDGRKHSNYRP